MGINSFKECLEECSDIVSDCSEKKRDFRFNTEKNFREKNYADDFDIICDKEENKREKDSPFFESEEDVFERRINESEDLKKKIVFSGKVDENFDYGEGGGKQYFIQDAAILKDEGKLIPISEERCTFNPLTDIYVSDVRQWNKDEGTSYTVHLDHRVLEQSDAEGVFVGDDFSEEPVEKTVDLDMEEIKYLDENTPVDAALDEIDGFGGKVEEDYRHPLGNQEDSKGFNHPDKWSNPRDLMEGEKYYQLEPVFSDGSKTKSSYFTDQETVDSCRDENGTICLSKLMQKLQKSPNIECITNEKGEKRDQYVKEYSIVQYIVKPDKNI